MTIQQQRIEAALREIVEAIGEDPRREGISATPARVAAMYAELFSGLDQDPRDVLTTSFEEGPQEMVILRDIPFFSMCEHHLLPFHGVVHIGYIPRGRVVGVSKLVRALEVLARRPQVQERLTTQLAEAILSRVQPDGVAVVIQAEHLCMTMRGVKKPGSTIVTSATRGFFRSRAVTRAEFLSLLHGR